MTITLKIQLWKAKTSGFNFLPIFPDVQSREINPFFLIFCRNKIMEWNHRLGAGGSSRMLKLNKKKLLVLNEMSDVFIIFVVLVLGSTTLSAASASQNGNNKNANDARISPKASEFLQKTNADRETYSWKFDGDVNIGKHSNFMGPKKSLGYQHCQFL